MSSSQLNFACCKSQKIKIKFKEFSFLILSHFYHFVSITLIFIALKENHHDCNEIFEGLFKGQLSLKRFFLLNLEEFLKIWFPIDKMQH